MKPRPMQFVRSLSAVSAAGLLAACDRSQDPGMVEKVALLEAELRDRDAQLAALQEQEQASSATDPASKSSAGAPDLDAARGAYLGFVESLRTKLTAALPGAKFERTSVFPVEGPDPAKPIFSRVAFRITSKDGRSGEMLIPLSADTAGSWQEPETGEIVANFKSKLAAPPEPAKTPEAPAPQTRTQPADVMGANRTVEVQWGDTPRSNAPPAAPPSGGRPPPAPPAPSPAVPKKVMPTSRDVIIDFDDP